MNLPGSIWDENPSLIDRLRFLAGEKRSAQEIADILGHGLTRSAITGKARRLGITLKCPLRKALRDIIDVPHVDLGHAPFRFPDGSLVTIERISDKHCRNPVGQPGADDFFYCGRPPKTGSVYCELCHPRLKQPLKPGSSISPKDKAILANNARVSGMNRAFG